MCGGVCDGGGGNGVSVGVQGRGDTAGKNSLVVQIPVLEHTTPFHHAKEGFQKMMDQIPVEDNQSSESNSMAWCWGEPVLYFM